MRSEEMSTNPGVSVQQDEAAVEAWIDSLPSKETVDLLRDQVILLNAVHQDLVQLQRTQLKMLASLDELADIQAEPAEVRISDVEMRFTSMVWLILKWALATIPAALILAFIAGLAALALSLLGWLPPFYAR